MMMRMYVWLQIDGFHDVLGHLGKAVCAHHHGSLSPSMPNIELEQHRVVFIGLSLFTIRLVDTLVPRHFVSCDVGCRTVMSLGLFDAGCSRSLQA